MNGSIKMTPQVFWASIKDIALTKYAQLQLQHHLDSNAQIGLQEEVSILSSHVKELTGYHLFPLSDTEQLANCVFDKDKNTQPQNHQYQMDNHVLAQDDHQNIQGNN
ncbi:MAG: hypothetical protein AB1423_10915 [Pseudomonadota bacterium]